METDRLVMVGLLMSESVGVGSPIILEAKRLILSVFL